MPTVIEWPHLVMERSSLRNIEVEAWARRIIHRVVRSAPIEDARVELKREWPTDYSRAARRIAGHCNASAGDELLWLIGLDERAGVHGVISEEMASWWPAVKAQFDGQAPAIRNLVIEEAGRELVALLINADRAPYVVRNPFHGQQNAGPVSLEVPWRDGTTTRTATREDLLRILVPQQILPGIEITDAGAELRVDTAGIQLVVSIACYAVVPMGTTVVLPNHQAAMQVRMAGQAEVLDDFTVSFRGPATYQNPAEDPRLHTVRQGVEQIILEGPGFLRVTGISNLAVEPPPDQLGPVEVLARVRPAGCERHFTLEVGLEVDEIGATPYRSWQRATWKARS